MIGHTIWRGVVVVFGFLVGALIALAVLCALGAAWTGEELQAIAAADPDFRSLVLEDPLFRDPDIQRQVALAFGTVVFFGTVVPALTALPAFALAVAGEVMHVRSWMYYVLAGGVALAAIPLLASIGLSGAEAAALPAGQYMTIFATAGFAGGFIYWLLAGRGA